MGGKSAIQMLSVFILVFVGYTRTATPPPTPPPTTPPPTTPLMCEHYGETYQVGEKTGSPCEPCECMSDGTMACMYIDCLVAKCVDAVKQDCCHKCPNGFNCRHGKEVIKVGEVKHFGGMTCRCPGDEIMYEMGLGTEVVDAVCSTETTTPKPITCEHQGETYQVGETTGGPCNPCECLSDGFMACMVIDCSVAMCVDAVKQDCCYSCPNGFNCRHEQDVIKVGEVKHIGGMECRCPDDEMMLGMGFGTQVTDAVCTAVPPSPPTTPPLPTARITCEHLGQTYQVGEIIGLPCKPCECKSDGVMSCIVIDCMVAKCVDAVRDGCCYRCPNDLNCKLRRRTLKLGEVKRRRRRVCTCPADQFRPEKGYGSRVIRAVCKRVK